MPLLPVFDTPAMASHASPVAHVAPAESAPIPLSLRAPLPQQTVDSHGYTYVVEGNTLLGRSQLADAIRAGASPKDVLSSLKRAYAARGHFLVGIVARVQSQRVYVQVVEGRLTHIEGPEGMAAFFSRLKDDRHVRSSDVVRQSLLAQTYAATNGQQPQISFKPAPEVGGSTMLIQTHPAEDPRPIGGSLTVGNFGNRYAGHQLAQAQAYVRHNGVTVSANYTRALTGMDPNTRGAYYAASGATVSWVNPWGNYQFDDQYTKYELGKAFAPLYPIGHIHAWGVSGTQFLYADDSTRWTLSEGAHAVRDRETVFKYLYTLRDQRYLVTDVGTDASWRFAGLGGHPASVAIGAKFRWGGARAHSGFQKGLGQPNPHFRIFTANVSYTQAVANDWLATASLSGQSSTATVPSREQWVLGGLNNVGAWLPGTAAGDRGYLARVSVQVPRWSLGPVRMRPAIFAEHGAARYSYLAPKAPVWQGLTDAGVSLNMDVPSAGISALLAYAKPLDNRGIPAKTVNGQRAHLFFYLQVGF